MPTKQQETLKNSRYIVTEVETKPTQSRAKAPFITSTLQQTASTRLGFGVKKNHVVGTTFIRSRLYYLYAYRLD